MPGGTRTGRGLAYCTVHWRIRPRPARPDNRRKRVTNQRVPGAGRSSQTSGSHGCPADQGRQAGHRWGRPAQHRLAPDEVNTALPGAPHQPGGTCRQSVISP